MTENVTLEIIKTTGIIVTAILSFVGVVLTVKGNRKQEIIHKQINGQQDLLLKVTGAEREAIGKEKGKKEQRDEGKSTAAEVIKQIQEDDDIQITKT